MSLDEFARVVQSNSLSVFGLEFLSNEQVNSVFELEARTHEASSMKSSKTSKQSAAALPVAPVLSSTEHQKLKYLKAAAEYFGCLKCRNKLFTPIDISTHALDAAKTTIFKVGEEGLCQTVIFVPCDDNAGNFYLSYGQQGI